MRINGKTVIQRDCCEDCNYFFTRIHDGMDNEGTKISCEYMPICEMLERTLKKNDELLV